MRGLNKYQTLESANNLFQALICHINYGDMGCTGHLGKFDDTISAKATFISSINRMSNQCPEMVLELWAIKYLFYRANFAVCGILFNPIHFNHYYSVNAVIPSSARYSLAILLLKFPLQSNAYKTLQGSITSDKDSV